MAVIKSSARFQCCSLSVWIVQEKKRAENAFKEKQGSWSNALEEEEEQRDKVRSEGSVLSERNRASNEALEGGLVSSDLTRKFSRENR